MSECIHEMDPTWCATCKHGPRRRGPEQLDYSFTAKYDSQCGACDLPIHTESVASITTWLEHTGNYEYDPVMDRVEPIRYARGAGRTRVNSV